MRTPQRWTLTVNGRDETVEPGESATLLHVLRNDLGLNGPKYGCGLGQCGACTVLVDAGPGGRVAARACVIPAAAMAGRTITTLEGLGSIDAPHPVQQAFIDAQAAQCGYCLNGMILATVALLAHTPRPTRAQIAAALSHNLCRCGTHIEIVEAVLLASGQGKAALGTIESGQASTWPIPTTVDAVGPAGAMPVPDAAP